MKHPSVNSSRSAASLLVRSTGNTQAVSAIRWVRHERHLLGWKSLYELYGNEAIFRAAGCEDPEGHKSQDVQRKEHTDNPFCRNVVETPRQSMTGHLVSEPEVTGNPVSTTFSAEYPALPRFKDNKTIRVADEDAAEEYRGQQSIFLRR